MNQKYTLFSCLVLSALAAGSSLRASPLVSIGDNTDIFFNGSSSVVWTSNLYRDENDEEDDLIFSIKPGFELNVGRGVSNVDLSLITGYDIRRYSDNGEQDVELFNIDAVGSYRSSRLDLSASAGFNEQKSSSGDESFSNLLIESDNWNARINGEYRVSPKFSFGLGFRYNEKEYEPLSFPFNITEAGTGTVLFPAGTSVVWFADRSTTAVPIDVYYELTPKVDLTAGYTYSETDVDAAVTNGFGDYTTEDHFINVGARGNLLPKLTGFFKVGYRMRDFDRPGDNDDESTLGLDADLTWATTPKLTTRLGASRDFGVGGEGQSTENTGIDLSFSYAINSHFDARAFGSFTRREYESTREDDQSKIGASLTYAPNQYWSFVAGYAFSENDSNLDDRSYEDNSINFSASLRY